MTLRLGPSLEKAGGFVVSGGEMPKRTVERGYGYAHRKLREQWRPKVDAGLVDCWRCGRPILPGQEWDLGHDDHDRTQYRGPEHAKRSRWCIGNRAAGSRKRAWMNRTSMPTPITSRDW